MKLVTDIFNSTIVFDENIVNSLVIENPKIFNKFISNLVNQINGEEGQIIISEENKELKISNTVDLITNYIPFDINNKKLLTKIAGTLEKEAVNEINYSKTAELLADIERFVDQLSTVLPCNLIYESISASSLIKMMGLKISNDSMSELENIFDYMTLVRELDRDKLFVFVNIRAYYDDMELQDFLNTIIAHKFKVLLIDSHSKRLLNSEKRLTIDYDLCEI